MNGKGNYHGERVSNSTQPERGMHPETAAWQAETYHRVELAFAYNNKQKQLKTHAIIRTFLKRNFLKKLYNVELSWIMNT